MFNIGFLQYSNIPTENPIWNNLLSYWRMDVSSGTNVPDSKGSIYGTSSNVSWVTGKNNNGASFSNTTSYIELTGGSSTYNFNRTDSFTISFWLKRNTINTTQFLFSKSLSSGNYSGYSAYFNTSNNIEYSLMSTNSSTIGIIVLSTSSYGATGVWYNFVFTYNGNGSTTGLKIYLNGTVQGTSSALNNLSTNTTTSTATFRIGNRSGSNFGQRGVIDEFSIWDRVLTDTEITELYNGGSGTFY